MPPKATTKVRPAATAHKMTDAATDAHDHAKHVARIAVQFGRQAPAQAMTVETIADDARRMAALGRKVRHALEQKRRVARMVSEARAIAERYGAVLIDQRDLNGAVLCLRFTRGLYSAGFRNLFFVY